MYSQQLFHFDINLTPALSLRDTLVRLTSVASPDRNWPS